MLKFILCNVDFQVKNEKVNYVLADVARQLSSNLLLKLFTTLAAMLLFQYLLVHHFVTKTNLLL